MAKKAQRKQHQAERERPIGEQRKANFFSERRASKNGSSSESQLEDEAEMQYVEIPVNECNGTANLGSFVAAIDDDSEQDVDEIVEEGT
jgi:hypothetical protein